MKGREIQNKCFFCQTKEIRNTLHNKKKFDKTSLEHYSQK